MAKAQGIDVWLPPGLFSDPEPDRRRWNAHTSSLVKSWERVFDMARQHPDKWLMLCVSNRAAGICHRVRTGQFAGTKEGRWEAKQRAVGHGFSLVRVRMLR